MNFIINLDRNTQSWQSEPIIALSEEDNIVSNENIFKIEQPYYWQYYSNDPTYKTTVCNIKFNINSASCSEILIKDMKIEVKDDEENIRKKGVEEFLYLDTDQNLIKKSNDQQGISLLLFHCKIKEMKKPKECIQLDNNLNKQEIECKISFEYQENINTDNYNTNHFSFTIQLAIIKAYSPKWTCIDFGTSAIAVAQKNMDGEDMLFDLQTLQKDTVEKYEDTDFYKTPRFEENTKFISSTIMLNNKGYLSPPDSESTKFKYKGHYDELVQFSPTVPRVQANPDRVLPPIKTIIGSNKLNYRNVFYKERTDNDDTPARPFSDTDLDTFEIFKKAYTSFLDNYIEKQSEHPENIILTIPNTFTPTHTNLLKEMIIKYWKEKQWYLRRLELISESDAVAIYYVSNWKKFNKNKDVEEDKVLVYDMGAGTLDLTYFTIKKTGNNIKIDTHITSKLGSVKAGNYFDNIIAECICKTHQEKNIPEDLYERNDQQAARFKDFVKNVVKPQLFKGNVNISWDTTTTNENKEIGTDIDIDRKADTKIEINLEKVLKYGEKTEGDKIIKGLIDKYIEDCSTKILEILELSKDKNEKNRVDSIIFTGRASQITKLRDEIRGYFTENSKPNEIDLSKESPDILKSAVAMGALKYVALFSQEGSKINVFCNNILCSYGFIYEELGEVHYQELLNPKTADLGVAPIYKDGILIKQYDTDTDSASHTALPNKGDIGAANRVHFVQSYLPKQNQTKDEWENGNRDFIFDVIEPKSLEQIRDDNRNFNYNPQRDLIDFRIRVDENNKMKINIGKGGVYDLDEELIPSINVDNQIFAKTMWPYWNKNNFKK